MIELQRAAIEAGTIAATAEFFSFGTKDLIQTTFGISRDAAAGFIGAYMAAGVFETDPFVTLDRGGAHGGGARPRSPRIVAASRGQRIHR